MDAHCYIPCLRWKLGEYQALKQLSSFARDLITPLVEIPEIGFDFETKKDSKSIDEHLKLFAKRMREKWGVIDECFVDMHLIDVNQRMVSGIHPVLFVFEDLRLKGVRAIPIMGLNQDSQWQDAIQQVVDQDNRGFCLRIDLETAIKPTLKTLIDELLQKYNRRVDQCDFILDETAPNFEPLDGFVIFLQQIINKLPYLNHWRSFGLIGTSLPASLSILGRGVSIIPRNEWRTYKRLQVRLRSTGIRVPTFGDYGINNPEIFKVDPRIMKTTANIRYTIADGWFIVRGKNIRDFGLGQHKNLCREIVNSKAFAGSDFSEGDKYILDCALGNASTGNLTTWRRVGTSHHLELVARDVANFAAS